MEILAEARKLDYDRTLAAINAKAPEPLFALIAFAGELEAIRRKTTDPITFEMRLLWWREALAEAENGSVRKHPLVQALATAVRFNFLYDNLLDAMISNAFRAYQETAPDFVTFLEHRKYLVEAGYMNSFLALELEEDAGNFSAFRALDAIKVLEARKFLHSRGWVPFHGEVAGDALEELIKQGRGATHKYFQGLNALAGWHFKRLKKVDFQPPAAPKSPFSPGKFLALWRENLR